MNQSHAQERIIAFDLRPRSFGYAVFESPKWVLDCGVKYFGTVGQNPGKAISNGLAALVQQWQPTALVVKRRHPRVQGVKLRAAMAALSAETKRHNLTLFSVSWRTVADIFGSKTKHEVATLLADQFPELAWKLPPKRRCWEAEPHRMSLFDAAAVGVAYFASLPSKLLEQESTRAA